MEIIYRNKIQQMRVFVFHVAVWVYRLRCGSKVYLFVFVCSVCVQGVSVVQGVFWSVRRMRED